MSEKNNILEAWIMIEHLSEGDINIDDTSLVKFDNITSKNYYSEFMKKLNEKNLKSKEKSGFVLYFYAFDFKDVITFLRNTYKLKEVEQDIKLGKKFSFALYFDKNMNLINESTFVTASFYILEEKKIPCEDDLQNFECELRKKYEKCFVYPENKSIEEHFNETISLILEEKHEVKGQCYMKALSDIESDTTNLHSFFIHDLKKAKKISSRNLDAYIKNDIKHVNLDRRYNSEVFSEILQPKNYPVARFPSNTKYSLSLMQQVAVNLATGYDSENMRSVNGPPGTGKTTLLKDVFAELVTQQAYEMANSSHRFNKGTGVKNYCNNESIGAVPEKIADKGIIVASSNNGAIQNIVNELPLTDKIDDNLSDAIFKADYFTTIANSIFKSKDGNNDKKVASEHAIEENNNVWGLFSLEGGKKENMNCIIKAVKSVSDYLSEKYESNPQIYQEFLEAYRKVCNYRKNIQNIADEIKEYDKLVEKEEEIKDKKFTFFTAKKIRKDIEQKKGKIESSGVDRLDLSQDYKKLQLSNPWFNETYRKLQSQLFITALKVRKQYLYENVANIKAACNIWTKQHAYIGHKEVIKDAWNWINLVIPVIGTTFASFGRMFKYMDEESLGHLFVDEAGQALPQAGVGSIFRSKHVMVVGDPAQIKPVLTLDCYVLKTLANYYAVSEHYLSEDASMQTLVDASSKYGFYKDETLEKWIGIPLWVHRRCQNPMFCISNRISYNGNMVQANEEEKGLAIWHDIDGIASDKYVESQGKALYNLIRDKVKENPDILEKNKKDIIYVISPFKNVAKQLAKKLDDDDLKFTRYDKNGKPTNVGTVHTFQGKEAPIVFLVLGADNNSSGAAKWAMGTQNPNIMNVAVTRAKKEFHIIGDKELYKRLDSDVINKTLEILENYQSEAK